MVWFFNFNKEIDLRKKIGILTIHGVYNYGAMLQAYALQTYISSQDVSVEIIDYRPIDVYRPYSLYLQDLVKRPRAFIRVLRNRIFRASQFRGFKIFDRNYLVKSSKVSYNTNDLNRSSYDIILTGSDQIWNPLITNWDDNYFGTWAESSIKISYSSSCGIPFEGEKFTSWFVEQSKEFRNLAVRERSFSDSLRKLLISAKIDCVLDPVFLLEGEHWANLSSDMLSPEFDYVLVYSLQPNDDLWGAASDLSRRFGIKILAVHPFLVTDSQADFDIVNAGPQEFLGLIKGARFVVTNSFHGVSFAIVFGVDFVCFPHSQTGSRIVDLLTEFSLSPFQFEENQFNYSIYRPINNSHLVAQRILQSKSVLSEILSSSLEV